MTMTDPVADMLTRLRNANMVYQDELEMPSSNIRENIARVLTEEGYIADYEVVSDGPQPTLRIRMKYGPNKQRPLQGLTRVSKPGLRVYVKKHEVPRVLGGLGIALVSTSRGMLTDQQARRQGVGGELIAYVW